MTASRQGQLLNSVPTHKITATLERKMKPNLTEKLWAALTMLDGAREAASAVRNRRKPSAASLRKLGLDPDSFNKIDL
jgi:hypothetical protein